MDNVVELAGRGGAFYRVARRNPGDPPGSGLCALRNKPRFMDSLADLTPVNSTGAADPRRFEGEY